MPETLVARFRIDGAEPAALSGVPPGWLDVIVFTKTFTAGIAGEAVTVFMSAGTEEGKRAYVASERISGRTDDGREGAFTVQHGGLEADPESWFGHIVPGTGTGDFVNWSGSARIEHDADGPYFRIELSSPDSA